MLDTTRTQTGTGLRGGSLQKPLKVPRFQDSSEATLET